MNDDYNGAMVRAGIATKDLVDAYIANPPQSSLAKAQSERRIWLTIPEAERSIIHKVVKYNGNWLQSTLNPHTTAEEFRVRYMTLGKALKGYNVDAVWDYLDNNGFPGYVYRVYTHINKHLKGEGFIKEDLQMFEDLIQIHIVDGKSLPKAPHRKPKKPKEEEKKRVRRPRPEPGADPIFDPAKEARDAWGEILAKMEEVLLPILKNRLTGVVEEHEQLEMFNTFKYETHAGYQILLKKIRMAASSESAKELIQAKRSEIVAAAGVLGIICPNRGNPDKSLAKKAWRTLSARFHPDRSPDPNNPDPKYVEQFRAIQNAWAILDQNI